MRVAEIHRQIAPVLTPRDQEIIRDALLKAWSEGKEQGEREERCRAAPPPGTIVKNMSADGRRTWTAL